ncbi:MAG: hypothetical protein GY814_06885 [Gammaproteobacteria bacterium]|nr:hypothetical protein [Gammaproteobacteria bacterium]
MIDMGKYFDPYERKARLYPGLICLFPILVTVSINYPKVYSTLSGFVALAAAVGILQLISHLARDRGKRLEPSLYETWGGMPSVVILRHRDSMLPRAAKLKYHHSLEKESGIKATTPEMEEGHPGESDDIYTSWSDFLRTRSRDMKKYPLVYKELINYGFRRNLLGIKPYCLYSVIASIILIIAPRLSIQEVSEIQVAVVVCMVIYMMILTLVVTREWVRTVAFAYAKSLVESIN